MSLIKCQKCQNDFNGEKYPYCPLCLAKTWNNSPGFVKPKHDPHKLPLSMDEDRSVLSCEVVNNLARFTEFAANNGSWYQRTRDKSLCHYTDYPLHTIPGSVIYKGDPMPSVALSGLLIAKPASDPHAYCVDILTFKAEIDFGKYVALPRCSQPGCRNLIKPGNDKCLEHLDSN